MTIRDIEQKYGLPAEIKIPIHDRTYGGTWIQTGWLYRTVLRRFENGHYSQIDHKLPHLGEFTMCYDAEVHDRLANDLEYLGKPEEQDIPF